MKTIIGLLLCFIIVSTANAAPMTICISSDGKVIARPKCKKSEVIFSMPGLAGFISSIAQTTAKPFNINGCRYIEASTPSQSGMAAVRADCQANEFLLNYGFFYSPINVTTALAIEEIMIYDSQKVPVGIVVAARNELEMLPGTTSYNLTITGTCCPR